MVDFTIGVQTHEWLFDQNGNRVGQWHIPFTTPSGTQSEIIVPDESYRAETVAPLIAAEVEVIEAVQHLTRGDPAPHRPAHVAHHPTHHAA